MLGILLVAFSFFAAACVDSPPPVTITRQEVRAGGVPSTNLPMPTRENLENLGWKTSEGKSETLKTLRGKVLVLDMWATYCPPCIEEIPHLSKLQEQYGLEKIRVVGLHVGGEEDKEKIPAFLEKHNMSYTLAYPDDELTRILTANDSRIPQTFVFDEEGVLLKKIIGFSSDEKAALDKAVADALN